MTSANAFPRSADGILNLVMIGTIVKLNRGFLFASGFLLKFFFGEGKTTQKDSLTWFI